MTYTQINFGPEQLPNVWDRHYALADGTVAVLSYVYEPDDNHFYAVTVHSAPPEGDWWDSVLKEVDTVKNLPDAEAIVAELTA